MSAQALSELEAIDATLSGASVAPAHAGLAELVHELRMTRPRARREFLEALDVKAADGFSAKGAGMGRFFERPARAARPTHPTRGSQGRRLMRPAMAAALAIALTAAVVVPFALSGSNGTQRELTPHSAGVEAAPPSATAGAPAATGSGAAAAEEAPRSATKADSQPAASSSAATGSRQIERTATLDVGVAPSAIESASQQVFTLASSFNGYVRQSNVSSGSAQGGASFDLRIPSSSLSGAIAALSHLGHVRSENDTTNDITDQFNSLQGSLTDREAERQSLLSQLANTSDAQREESLKARLRAVERQIVEVRQAVGALRARVNFTDVALTLTAETPVGSKHGALTTPGSAARAAGQILETALAVAVIGLAAAAPLLVVGLIAWILVISARRRWREQALDAS